MNLRSSVAAGLVLVLIVATPLTVRAQEEVAAATKDEDALATPALVTPVVAAPALGLDGPRRLAFLGAPSALAPRLLFAPAPAEIRLSHGAKTAIIVTAIVVGCLVIGGVVVLSRPGGL